MNFPQAQGQHDCQQPNDPQPIKCAMNDCSNMIPTGDGYDIESNGKTVTICWDCFDTHCNVCHNTKVKNIGDVCEECRQAAMEDSNG